MIICRCFYPLIPVYYELFKAGIAAKIKNKDIASQLNSLLDEIVGETAKRYSCQKFTDTLQKWYESRKKEMRFDGVPITVVVDLHDRILTLNAIYTGNNCQDTVELTEAIERLSKSDKNEVFLTTIHGSKGLEAERVFHIRPDLLPHPRAEKDWEKEQEKNLQFVAATRAKHDLFLANK